MQASLGWTVLSKDALRRAEAQIQDDILGVRDEIGFLTLHQAYADRFFPGTTVLQTRLRYIFFVPWLYNEIAATRGSRDIYQEIETKEKQLVRRLMHLGLASGVIGGRSYPNPTSQPPAMVYWTALREWGLLKAFPDGSFPSRVQAHRLIRHRVRPNNLLDDDKQPLDIIQLLFNTLPEPPKEWQNWSTKLDFELQPNEVQFIKQLLIAVNRPCVDRLKAPSLLSSLVEHQIPTDKFKYPWSQEILNILNNDEKAALLRGSQVAAVAAIGRAIYAALVEKLRDEKDRLPTPEIHREYLKKIIELYSDDALSLDVRSVEKEMPQLIKSRIINVLYSTQQWLKGARNPSELLELYRQIELARKGQRARLADNLAGQLRRAEWMPENHPLAQPLSYRWGNVQRLLADLRDSL